MAFPDILDFVAKNGLALVGCLWFFYATLISNPPKLVPWVFYQKALDRIKELERKLEKADEQAARAVSVTGEAVKADKSTRGAGSGGSRSPERRGEP